MFDPEVEETLRALRPRGPGDGLRERILEGAAVSRSSRSRGLWTLAAASLVTCAVFAWAERRAAGRIAELYSQTPVNASLFVDKGGRVAVFRSSVAMLGGSVAATDLLDARSVR